MLLGAPRVCQRQKAILRNSKYRFGGSLGAVSLCGTEQKSKAGLENVQIARVQEVVQMLIIVKLVQGQGPDHVLCNI